MATKTEELVNRISNSIQELMEIYGPDSRVAHTLQVEMDSMENEQAETGHSVEVGLENLATVSENMVAFAHDIQQHFKEKRS